jgi:hypothetical protein
LSRDRNAPFHLGERSAGEKNMSALESITDYPISDFVRLHSRPRASERLGTGHVKGTILAAHVQWVKENRSADEYIRFWDQLAREARVSIGMVLPVKWYDFGHLMAIDHAILNLFGGGSTSILRDLGRHSARVNLGGAYKAYIRPSIHDFFLSSARLHSQFQDFGVAAYAARNDSSGIMTHSRYDSFSPLYCASATGFYQEAIVLHGGANVTVTEAMCQCRGDRTCSFVMRWS